MNNIFKILIICVLTSCINQKQKDEEQIKNTVRRFWLSVKENDFETYKSLNENSDMFIGIMHMEFSFLHKNYEKINPNDYLIKDIKIKDTVLVGKQKYVQYYIKSTDTIRGKAPLIITLEFYKPIGYDKLSNAVVLKNHLEWDIK